jgi:fused signal recognition particle receptor
MNELLSPDQLPILISLIASAVAILSGAGFYFFRERAVAPDAIEPSRPAPRTLDVQPSPITVTDLSIPTPDLPIAAPQLVELEVPTTMADAMSGTKSHFWGRVKGLFGAGTKLDLSDLEEVLYTSDLGPQTVERLLEEVTPAAKEGIGQVKNKLREQFEKIFDEAHIPEPHANPLFHLRLDQKPTVWMVVGVNGAGKTTSIGKISAQLAQQGKKVMVAAGDTFRAAAGAQLKVWTDRAENLALKSGDSQGMVEIFYPEGVADPSAVAFDAVAKAKAREFDVVIIDTAGRLHTQAHLMDELKKVKRVLTKVIADAPHETLIVLDANNGQNALHQAREFNQALGLTGVILTKMDGTAKGGVAVGLSNELKIPIRLIGIGEKVQDLRAFSSREFISSILDEA